jgi:hypothetical protein
VSGRQTLSHCREPPPKSKSLYSQPFLSITSSAIVGEGGSLTLYLYYSTDCWICQAFFLGRWGNRTPTLTSPHTWGILITCSPVCAGGATRTHIIPLPTQPTTPATDGRTRLERVGWHTWGIPATEAHHLRFAPLLYHNWGNLSSLIFCREDT